MRNKVLAIVQVRLGSSRFPGKVMQKLGGKTISEILFRRLKKTKYVDKIIFATTKNQEDKKLVSFLKEKKINVFVGSEQNVLSRYYNAAKNSGASISELSNFALL